MLDTDNFYCSERDSLFCGDREGFGPYLLLEALDDGPCDTLYFLNSDLTPRVFDPSCGITVHVNTTSFSNSLCEKLKEVEVDIFQSCYGNSDPSGMCSISESEASFTFNSAGQIFATCSFWLVDKDTIPPSVACDLSSYNDIEMVNGVSTIYLDAGSECLNMDMNLPPVQVSDSCNDILIVKAMVDTFGFFIYEFNPAEQNYISEVSLSLHYRTEPYLVIFEAIDICRNIARDTCAIVVRDAESPTAVF